MSKILGLLQTLQYSFCTFICTHPLYLAFLLFFSPYLLQLLFFFSPLLLTTSLLLLTLPLYLTTPSQETQVSNICHMALDIFRIEDDGNGVESAACVALTHMVEENPSVLTYKVSENMRACESGSLRRFGCKTPTLKVGEEEQNAMDMSSSGKWACKISNEGVVVDGGEGMDLLWEAWEEAEGGEKMKGFGFSKSGIGWFHGMGRRNGKGRIKEIRRT